VYIFSLNFVFGTKVGTIKRVIGGRVFMTLMAYEYSHINIIDDYEILVLITSAVPVVGVPRSIKEFMRIEHIFIF
jgi:hypothetical protein